MKDPVISLLNVSKSYGQPDLQAVCNVSMEILSNQFVAIVGESGSGKTSLLRMINRLTVPDAGEVQVFGANLATCDIMTLRRSIGYVFQGIGLFPHLTVAENILMIPKLVGWSPTQASKRLAELMALVELPESLMTRYPETLSGGQKQRVALARALAARPKIILMDEPFGALDPISRDSLGTTYRKLHDEFKLTTLMVTHDIQEAVLLADRIGIMHRGKLIADDTPGCLLGDQQDHQVSSLMEMPRKQANRIQKLLSQSQDETSRPKGLQS